MYSTSKLLKLNLNNSKSIYVLHDNRITSSIPVPTIQLLNGKVAYPWEVNFRRLKLTTLLDLVPGLRMRRAISSRHSYVTIMCTGTAVTFYIYCSVICKIAGSHLQLY